MDVNAKIYVAGHTGLVGSAIVEALHRQGFNNLILKTHELLDLTDQQMTDSFFSCEKPQYVFVAAGLVGGIKANAEHPADFFTVNMQIANNIILSSWKYGVKKLLYLGSACMYPKLCSQPMREEQLLTGLPEITNEGYALAKICGTRLCTYMKKQYGSDFISAIPANAYGLGDSFDPEHSHVIPALIMKYHMAKTNCDSQVDLWGSGKALREFIYTDDLAEACVFLMMNYSGELPVNIGTGEEISILELSKLIKKIVGYKGEIKCDLSKPDGMMRRVLDSTHINRMGWNAKISIERGLETVYREYKKLFKC